MRQPQNQLNLTPHSSFYRDKTGLLTIEQIQKIGFTKIDNPTLEAGLKGEAVWIKIELKNLDHDNDDWVLVSNSQHIEYLDFYVEESENGKFRQELFGRFWERNTWGY